MLQFDPETLETKGFKYFNKSTEDVGSVSFGSTHIQKDLSTGDLIGLAGAYGMSNTVTFYRIKASDSNSRIKIGTVNIRSMGWFHSFGITDKVIVFLEHPISISMKDMILGKPISMCYDRDNSKNSIVHVMNLDGENVGKY